MSVRVNDDSGGGCLLIILFIVLLWFVTRCSDGKGEFMSACLQKQPANECATAWKASQ